MDEEPKDLLRVDVDNGKYTVIIDNKTGGLSALRHGEKWRDCCGDNLIYFLAVELNEARNK